MWIRADNISDVSWKILKHANSITLASRPWVNHGGSGIEFSIILELNIQLPVNFVSEICGNSVFIVNQMIKYYTFLSVFLKRNPFGECFFI